MRRVIGLLFSGALVMSVASCGDDDGGGARCGNDIIEGTEVCDGVDLGGQSCATQGFDSGTLACSANCAGFDTSGCTFDAVCGDDVAQGAEVCDGVDLSGQTCASQGFDGGTLACNATCDGFDTGGCFDNAVCGDNVVEGNEVCDGADLNNTACTDLGFDGGTLACNVSCDGFDVSGCTGTGCGDGVVQAPELCDGGDLNGEDCASQGFDGGTLVCSPFCDAFDTSGCFDMTCGNDLVEGTEECDGVDLANTSCTDLGYTGGTLACAVDCTFDESGCTGGGTCGNGVAEVGEMCDGADLKGQTCVSQGFAGGGLACNTTCSALVTDNCLNAANTCGNGIQEVGEMCDGNDVPAGCDAFGGTGTMVCTTGCTLDMSGCTFNDMCATQGWYGDGYYCDPCELYGGTPDPDCQLCGAEGTCVDWIGVETFLVPSCELLGFGNDPDCGTCGDGTRDQNEYCDSSDLGGADCTSLGFASGTLACTSGCSFDTNGCAPANCGDGTVEGLEECDGSNLDGNDCTTIGMGFISGTLACDNNCRFDTSGCVSPVCGNGVTEGSEQCDDGNTTDGDGCSSVCEIEAGGVCTPVSALTCGGSVTANNNDAGSTNNINLYSCSGWDESGPEMAYSLTAPSNGHLTATLSNMTTDLDVFVLDDQGGVCNGANCAAVGNTSASIPITSGSVYYVVVDGYQGATGPFTLDLACTICGNGTVEPPEQCDDGNTSSGDGCDAQCNFESGLSETEPNNSSASANGPVTADILVDGAITPAGDNDWFAVTVPGPSSTLTATVVGFGGDQCGPAGNIDTELEILGIDGTTQLSFNDDINASTNYCSSASATTLPAGTYYVRVAASTQYCPTCTFPYAVQFDLQ